MHSWIHVNRGNEKIFRRVDSDRMGSLDVAIGWRQEHYMLCLKEKNKTPHHKRTQKKGEPAPSKASPRMPPFAHPSDSSSSVDARFARLLGEAWH